MLSATRASAAGLIARGPGRGIPHTSQAHSSALITGAGGFAGGHLARYLRAHTDWELWGTTFRPDEIVAGIETPKAIAVDLRDPGQARDIVARVRPRYVFHLAGQTYVPESWADPWATIETNVRMQLNILEAVNAGAPAARLVAVISNEVYGAVPPERLPVDESEPLAPSNPYATSKAAQDLLAGQYGRSPGLDIVRVRPFNHIGPGQDGRFVAASIARQVAESEAGLREPVLLIGDTSAERDFSDVRDIVAGYYLAATRGAAGDVFNLGSGVSHRIGHIVEFMTSSSTVAMRVEEDATRMRASDIPRTLCDNRRAQEKLGWAPQITFEQSLADILNDWRARVRQAVH